MNFVPLTFQLILHIFSHGSQPFFLNIRRSFYQGYLAWIILEISINAADSFFSA